MSENNDTPEMARPRSSAFEERLRGWMAASDRAFEANALAGGETIELSMLDIVGEDFWTGGGITSKAVQAKLDANPKAKTIKVLMNSPGGDAFEGLAIQSLLKRHGARVEIEVVGLAASAASIIAMAGDSIAMHEGALMMIHAPWAFAMGDAAEMRTTAAFLDKVNASALDVYTRRTGRDRAEVAALVADETWMTASEAVAAKFATGVITGTEPAKTSKAKAAAAATAFMSARKPLARDVESVIETIESLTAPTAEVAAANTQSPATPALPPVAETTGSTPEGTHQMSEEQKPVVAAVSEPTGVTMSGVKLLGVATEAEASAKIKGYQNTELQILAATGKQSMSDAMAVMAERFAQADQFVSMSKQNAELTAQARTAQRDAALERMSREGSLPPARHDWARSQFATAEAVESFCAGMPKGFFSAVTEQVNASSAVTLTDEEKRICQLTGVAEDKFLEQKKLDQQARSARVGG